MKQVIIIIATAAALFGPAAAAAQEAADAADAAPAAEAAETSEAPEAEASPIAEPVRSGGNRLLLEENAARARTNRIAAFSLGGWSLANLTWATVGLATQPDDRARGFHLSNAAVNLVVAGVAVTSYFSNLPNEEVWAEAGEIRTLEAAHAAEKFALVNAALDLAAVATGAFLTAQGNLKENEGLVGFGRSLMLQGAFLCAFDIGLFVVHAMRRGKFSEALTSQAAGAR